MIDVRNICRFGYCALIHELLLKLLQGLAPIASAIGVEMMVALLQHPLGGCAPSIGADGTLSEGAFGGIPHMVSHFAGLF